MNDERLSVRDIREMDAEQFELQFTAEEIFTIPNMTTTARIMFTEKVCRLVEEDPAKWGPLAIGVALTDNVDGILARTLDQETELGRRLDPIADVYFSTRLAIAMKRADVLPNKLFYSMMAQKGSKAVVVTGAKVLGVDLEVSKLGKYTEFAANAGVAGLLLAERIKDEDQKEKARQAAGKLAVAGTVGGFVNVANYARLAWNEIREKKA